MWPFGSDDENEDEPSETNETMSVVVIEYEKEEAYDYTEHHAVATLVGPDGELIEREYVFDKMKKKENQYVLKDYKDGLKRKHDPFSGKESIIPKGSEAWVTVERNDRLLDFETTKRVKKTLSEVFTKKVKVAPDEVNDAVTKLREEESVKDFEVLE